MPSSVHPDELPALIRSLLLLEGTSVAGTDVILTTQSQLWTDCDFGEVSRPPLIVNLATLFGRADVRSRSESRQFQSRSEERTYEQLITAGWTPSALQRRVRPSASVSHRLDFAACDSDGRVVGAFEVRVCRDEAEIQNAAQQLSRVFSIASIRLGCVTDGERYWLVSRDGRIQPIDGPPSPSDFGLPTEVATETRAAVQALHPRSAAGLTAIFNEHSPTLVVADETIPRGNRISVDDDVTGLLGDAELPSRRTDAIGLLLYWLSKRDHVKRLTTLVSSKLTYSEQEQWLREEMNRSFPLEFHAEFPRGLFATTHLPASLLRFNREARSTFFVTVPKIQQRQTGGTHDWFQSLAAFLDGKPIEFGFVQTSEERESWAIRQNNPQNAAIRTRIERLGRSQPLGDLCEVLRGCQVNREIEHIHLETDLSRER